MSQELLPAPIIVEVKHASGMIARAILPAWAQADAHVIQIGLRG